jgi:predicted phage replisome organizer
MAEKKYFWLKLPVDFFKDRVIKKLRRIAGGDTYTIIYQKMLLLSLENEGNIFFEEIEETFEDEMSLELDENVEDIQMTIIFLTKNKLMEKVDNYTYFMTQVPEMIGSETDSARRKRKSRNNKNVTYSQKSGTMSQENENKSQAVTKCPTEIEKEKELDLEKEKEKDLEIEKEEKKIDYTSILETYNTVCIDLPKAIKLTEKRKRLIKAYFKNHNDLNIMDYFKRINQAKFLCGSSGWKADFEFIFKADNIIKILEGKYDNDFRTNVNTKSENKDDMFNNLYQKYKT